MASSLNSSYCYILHSGSSVFTWTGNLTNSEDQELVERQLDLIKASCYGMFSHSKHVLLELLYLQAEENMLDGLRFYCLSFEIFAAQLSITIDSQTEPVLLSH